MASQAWSGRGTRCRPTTCIVPAGSLPHALRTELASIPAKVPYLAADEQRLAKWRERLGALPQPRVAFAWSGSTVHANDRNRSIALSRLAPWFAVGQGSFVSIQRDLRDGDADTLAGFPNVTSCRRCARRFR